MVQIFFFSITFLEYAHKIGGWEFAGCQIGDGIFWWPMQDSLRKCDSKEKGLLEIEIYFNLFSLASRGSETPGEKNISLYLRGIYSINLT